MGVYIKRMAMPISCADCPLRCYDIDDQKYCGASGNSIRFEIKRPSDCPLVEIPSSHGIMIDINEFLEEFSELESYRTAMSLFEIIQEEDGET